MPTDFPETMPDGVSPQNEELPVKPSFSLAGRVAVGASWTLIVAIVNQVMGIGRTIALARLLSQEDFGVAAMASTVIGALYTFTNTGIGASIISSQFESDEECTQYANTVWTIEICRGLVIAFAGAILAIPMSRFYGDARLIPVLFVLALTPILTSLTNIGMGLQKRQMELKRSSMHNLLSTGLGVMLSIFLAWWTRNYWALVWGTVVGAGVGTALSYVFSPFRPRLNFNKQYAWRAFNFGKHIFVIGLADYALTMMDNVLVGRFLGATVLGAYVVAYTFCNLPRGLIGSVFNSVLFPAFSSIKRENNDERLNHLVGRSFALGCVALLLLLTPLIILAPAIVRVLYGTQWLSSVAPMRILLIAGFFGGLASLVSAFLVGINRPNLESRAKVLDAITFLVLIYPFTYYMGMIGAALAGCIVWSLAVMWRWKWAGSLAPRAFASLPSLIFGALASGTLVVFLGVAFNASFHAKWTSFTLASLFSTHMPPLVTAWVQLLVEGPLLAAASVFSFAVVHPLARAEIKYVLAKIRPLIKVKRGAQTIIPST